MTTFHQPPNSPHSNCLPVKTSKSWTSAGHDDDGWGYSPHPTTGGREGCLLWSVPYQTGRDDGREKLSSCGARWCNYANVGGFVHDSAWHGNGSLVSGRNMVNGFAGSDFFFRRKEGGGGRDEVGSSLFTTTGKCMEFHLEVGDTYRPFVLAN